MVEILSRREFMGKGALMAGGALGCLAMGRALIGPGEARAGEVAFKEGRCGGEGQGDRVLVAYASRCGSTGGVAQAIGEVLCERGASVEVLRVENVRDLRSYCAVVLGGAIQRDRWLSDASDFVVRHRESLSRVPVAYFLTCLTLARASEQNRQKASMFLDPLRSEVPEVIPLDTGLFAGVLDYEKLSFAVRLVMKSRMKDKGVAEGDYRDWSAIRSWALGVAPQLLRQEVQAH